jgi:5-methylcytosine-specific restriction protein A
MRPCLEPRCPNLVLAGRCPEHTPSNWGGWGGATNAAYRGAWPKIRANVLKEERTCRLCRAPANHVDHIRPRARGGTDDRSNLRALCARCHHKVTAAMSPMSPRKNSTHE